jgi:excisionase family DNA binding protein
VTSLDDSLRKLITEVVRDEIKRALAAAKPHDEFLTTSEAATLAKVAIGSIRRWIRQGKLKRHVVGKTLRVSRAELDRLLQDPGPDHELSPEEQADRDFA